MYQSKNVRHLALVVIMLQNEDSHDTFKFTARANEMLQKSTDIAVKLHQNEGWSKFTLGVSSYLALHISHAHAHDARCPVRGFC